LNIFIFKGGNPMPGLNRRGPEGMGPMTGGGRGLCNPANRSIFSRGFSAVMGGCRGRGMGFGLRRWGRDRSSFSYDSNQEAAALRSEAEMLKNELEAVERRINDLKKQDNV
jgi:hypothetical protein